MLNIEIWYLGMEKVSGFGRILQIRLQTCSSEWMIMQKALESNCFRCFLGKLHKFWGYVRRVRLANLGFWLAKLLGCLSVRRDTFFLDFSSACENAGLPACGFYLFSKSLSTEFLRRRYSNSNHTRRYNHPTLPQTSLPFTPPEKLQIEILLLT